MIVNFNNKYMIGQEVVIKQWNSEIPEVGWFPDDEGNQVCRVLRYNIIDIKVSVKTLELTYCLEAIDDDKRQYFSNNAFVNEDKIICLAKDFNFLKYISAIKNVEE